MFLGLKVKFSAPAASSSEDEYSEIIFFLSLHSIQALQSHKLSNFRLNLCLNDSEGLVCGNPTLCVCVCVFKVRAADGDPRGLLWVLDEEMVTPGSSENSVLGRVCQYYSNTGKKAGCMHTQTQSLCQRVC